MPAGLLVVFWLCAALALVYWLLQVLLFPVVARAVPLVRRLPEGEREQWPRLSLIMTACNEEASLESAVEVTLREDYPNLELILVEDRSTDSTPQLADRLAERDPRLKVIHLTELPPGWLGKLNALNQGLRASTGEWILFSDADVPIPSGTLRRVVAYAESEGLDHVPILPQMVSMTPLIEAASCVFERLLCVGSRPWQIGDPRSSAAVGSGAFNLFRRSVYDRSKGLEQIKLELGDDVALGLVLKEAGARSRLLAGQGVLRLKMYASVAELARGTERTIFVSLGDFTWYRPLIVAVVLLLVELSPFLALLLGVATDHWVLGAALVLLATLANALYQVYFNAAWRPVLLWPLGPVVFAVVTARAGFLGARRGGVFWRGTFYSTETLREGRRVKLA